MRTVPRFFPRSAQTPRFRHGRGRSQQPQSLAVVYETHDVRDREPRKRVERLPPTQFLPLVRYSQPFGKSFMMTEE